MSLTRAQIRALLYLIVPGLGRTGTASSVGATGVVDASTFSDTEKGDDEWVGTSIYIPSETGANRVKPAGLRSGSTLLHSSATNYTGTPSTSYEIVGLVHPDELNECIRKGLKDIFFPTMVPHTLWDDGDFSAATAGSFTPQDANSAVSTKSALALYNDVGFRSLILTNGGVANGRTETPSRFVSPGDRIGHGALNRVAAAHSVGYCLYDVTHGAVIGSTYSHSERTWQRIWAVDTIPAGCYEVRARMIGAEAAAVTYWDALPSVEIGNFREPAPSWVTQPYNLISLREAHYGRTLATNQAVARSRSFTDWKRPSDYDLETFEAEAMPATLQVNRVKGFPNAELWYYGKRPWSDKADLSDETETTDATEAQVVPAAMYHLMLLLESRYGEPEWTKMRMDAEVNRAAERVVRPPVVSRPEVKHYTPGGRR